MPRLAGLEGTAAAYETLRDLVPVIVTPPAPPIEVSAPPGSFFAASSGPARMVDRGRTLSVVLAPTSLVVETSAYTQFEDFLVVLERAVHALDEAGPVAGIERVGLRYIDEVRVPGVEHPGDWAPYIHPSLLTATSLDAELVPDRTEGLAQFEHGNGRKTVMRFGALRGWVVDPSGPLRLRRTDDGPFFLLDLDSFWLRGDDAMPEFSPQAVLEICAELRRPVRILFESAITERLRDEVLRQEGDIR